METTLKVDGMTCNNCTRHVHEALMKVSGVKNASVNLDRGEAKVEHDGIDVGLLVAAIAEEGYEAVTFDGNPAS